jgi:SAM-dependent methyltransferase
MSRFMLLEHGEELRIKLLDPVRPFREADVLRVRPGRAAGRGGRFVVYRDGARLVLGDSAAAVERGECLGAVTGVERGPLTVAVDRMPWPRLPTGSWAFVIDALEILRRLRHPLTPPLFQGSPVALLRGVLEKYDAPVETAQYGAFATGELDEVERALVAEHVPPGGLILDIGCGGGREAVGLARLGYRVVGIDLSPRMIDAARRRAAELGVDVAFRVQSVTDLDEPAGAYDAAFFCGSLHHVPGRALRIETLRRIRQALAPGGVLLLMVVYRERRGLVSRSRMVDAVRRAARFVGAGAAVAEPGDGYMIEVSDGSDPSRACFFHNYDDPRDVRAELEAAGFAAHEARPGWWICRGERLLCYGGRGRA